MKTTKLYDTHTDGPIWLEFDRQAHKYFAKDAAGERRPVPSATGVTGLVSGSARGLIWWAAGAAADQMRRSLELFTPTEAQVAEAAEAVANGDRVEDVLRQGFRFDEVWVDQVAEECRRAHQRLTKEAQGIGNQVHDFCEAWIRYRMGLRKEPKQPVNPAARRGVEAFLDWISDHKVRFHFTERKIYSRAGHYAGTADIGMTYEGVLGVGDFKTSKSVYDNHHWQTAAYLGALKEELGEEWEGRWIIHLDKTTGDFGVYESKRPFEEDFEVFSSLRAVHQAIKGY